MEVDIEEEVSMEDEKWGAGSQPMSTYNFQAADHTLYAIADDKSGSAFG